MRETSRERHEIPEMAGTMVPGAIYRRLVNGRHPAFEREREREREAFGKGTVAGEGGNGKIIRYS